MFLGFGVLMGATTLFFSFQLFLNTHCNFSHKLLSILAAVIHTYNFENSSPAVISPLSFAY